MLNTESDNGIDSYHHSYSFFYFQSPHKFYSLRKDSTASVLSFLVCIVVNAVPLLWLLLEEKLSA